MTVQPVGVCGPPVAEENELPSHTVTSALYYEGKKSNVVAGLIAVVAIPSDELVFSRFIWAEEMSEDAFIDEAMSVVNGGNGSSA